MKANEHGHVHMTSSIDLSRQQQQDDAVMRSIVSSEEHLPRYWSTRWKSSRGMDPEWRQLYLNRAKLKAVSRTSALIAGFAMVAMVEVQLQEKELYNEWLLVCFSVITTALVTVHLFALMISTCMLPNIEAISSFHQSNAIQNSPHQRMRKYVEIAWILSTGVGLVLFLIEIALLIWLKFIPLNKRPKPQPCNGFNCTDATPIAHTGNVFSDNWPAWAATFILVPVVILFAGFACHFYMTLAKHRYSLVNRRLDDLNQLAENGEMMLPDRMEMLDTNFHDSSNHPSHRSSMSHFSNHNV